MVRLFINAFAILSLHFTQKHLSNIIAAAVEMPDAMEIIYQKALSVGTSGAVS